MGLYVERGSRAAENQIWDQIDRMRDAGPMADCFLAAQERRAWAIGTGLSARSGTNFTVVIATACRSWIGTCLIAVGRWLEGPSLVQTVGNGGFLAIQRRTTS